MLALDTLLPLRGINVTLQFTEKTSFRLFHQPIITAWLRHLIGNLPDYEQYALIDAPESGHSEYQADDYYRFAVLTLSGGEALLQHIIECLHLLPYSVRFQDDNVPLRDNVLLHSITDLWHDFPARHVSALTAYDMFMLQHEAAFWQTQHHCRLRWLSPVTLLLPRPQRDGKSGDKRFCRQKHHLSFSLLNDRMYDALANLLRQRETAVPARHSESVKRLQAAQVFWIDYAYYNAEGMAKPMGGLLGECVFDMRNLPATQWLYWVLGQYLGIGQRRVFGWGRYQLETLEGQSTVARARAVNSLLEQVSSLDNLQTAYEALRHDNVEGEYPEEEIAERLTGLAASLLSGTYKIPPLREQSVEKEDGSARLLQIAPFFDRVMQRAVAQVLTPILDRILSESRVGFRRGRSRYLACQKIQQAYQAGARWVFESDIEDFFENIQWDLLYTRLRAFLRDDALVSWIMQWISAPLRREGQLIERRQGLPQGSPLSPLLAYLILDNFDRDLEQLGRVIK